jgi:transcriptional regulator with XRE-family HTH domain
MKIPDLGQKLAYLKTVSEFIHLTQLVMDARRSNLNNPVTPAELDSYLRENRIADQIGVSEAQWSRIKKGKDSIDETRLSALGTYFDLDRVGGAELLERPYAEFQAVLRAKSYGKLKDRPETLTLGDRLRARANPADNSIRIIKIDIPGGQRGIGGPYGNVADAVDLRVGESVRIEIVLQNWARHLVVVTEDVTGVFVVLLPNASRRRTNANRRLEMLPAQEDTFAITRPLGINWLYTLSARRSVFFQRTELDYSRTRYPLLPEEGKIEFMEALETLPESELAVEFVAYEVGL